jgi:hypothetical protein
LSELLCSRAATHPASEYHTAANGSATDTATKSISGKVTIAVTAADVIEGLRAAAIDWLMQFEGPSTWNGQH